MSVFGTSSLRSWQRWNLKVKYLLLHSSCPCCIYTIFFLILCCYLAMQTPMLCFPDTYQTSSPSKRTQALCKIWLILHLFIGLQHTPSTLNSPESIFILKCMFCLCTEINSCLLECHIVFSRLNFTDRPEKARLTFMQQLSTSRSHQALTRSPSIMFIFSFQMCWFVCPAKL